MTHIPFKVSLLRLVFLLLPVTVAAQEARLSDYVDPRIGSEGLGRVFIGPSCPYGMVKPRPIALSIPIVVGCLCPNKSTVSPKYTSAGQEEVLNMATYLSCLLAKVWISSII